MSLFHILPTFLMPVISSNDFSRDKMILLFQLVFISQLRMLSTFLCLLPIVLLTLKFLSLTPFNWVVTFVCVCVLCSESEPFHIYAVWRFSTIFMIFHLLFKILLIPLSLSVTPPMCVVCSWMQIYVYYSTCMVVRRQLLGVCSLLPPWILGVELGSGGWHSKCFYPLSHLASLCSLIFLVSPTIAVIKYFHKTTYWRKNLFYLTAPCHSPSRGES